METTRLTMAIAAGALLMAGTPAAGMAAGPGIKLSAINASPGQEVELTATLVAAGGKIAGTQNDFSVKPPQISVKRKANGKPDCTVNPSINKSASTFVFRPANCGGDACNTVRVLVFSTEDVGTIPDGSVLYTCKLQLAAGAPAGTVPIEISGTILSDATGVRVCGSADKDTPCKGNVNGTLTVTKKDKGGARGKKRK